MKILALIPLRGGSKSIKDKNIIIPELIYNQSIVKKYFIEGKKYFSQRLKISISN